MLWTTLAFQVVFHIVTKQVGFQFLILIQTERILNNASSYSMRGKSFKKIFFKNFFQEVLAQIETHLGRGRLGQDYTSVSRALYPMFHT